MPVWWYGRTLWDERVAAVFKPFPFLLHNHLAAANAAGAASLQQLPLYYACCLLRENCLLSLAEKLLTARCCELASPLFTLPFATKLLRVSFFSVCSLRLFTILINSQKEFLLCFKCVCVCICLVVSVYCVRVACVFRVRVLCVGVCRRVGVFGSVLLLDFNFSLVNYRHPPVVRHRRPGYRTSTASGCLAAAA